ncbi:MAG: extracellular solute-binding protein [Promicromonosporaceae bacterium]|nr:extracellular solute-binding protein [Promicromonosporaceae bacterium]
MAKSRLKSAGTIAAAITLTLSLAGCGADTPAEEVAVGGETVVVETETPAIVETPDVVVEDSECSVEVPCELTFRWWGGDFRQQITLEALDLFHELNPDIVVSGSSTSFGEYYDQLTVEIVAGTQPDVFTLDRAWPIELGTAGALMDLMSLTPLDMTPYPASALANATVGDEIFGVTTGGNATALMINKDVFDAAGVELPNDDTWTWEEFADLAQQISENTPDGTFGIEIRPHAFLFAYANQRDGIGLFNADGDVNVSESTIADFYNMIIDLQDRGAAPSATLTSELMTAGPEEQLFGQGLAAMTFTPSNGIISSAAAAGTDNVILVRIPGETEFANPGTTVLASMFFAISANTRYPEAAARLVDFLVNDPDAADILRVDRGVPVNADIANHIIPLLDPLQVEQVNFMNRIAQYAVPGPSLPAGVGEFEPITFRTLEAAMFGQTSVDEAAASWVTQMQTALDDARAGLQ